MFKRLAKRRLVCAVGLYPLRLCNNVNIPLLFALVYSEAYSWPTKLRIILQSYMIVVRDIFS